MPRNNAIRILALRVMAEVRKSCFEKLVPLFLNPLRNTSRYSRYAIAANNALTITVVYAMTTTLLSSSTTVQPMTKAMTKVPM